MLDIQQVAAAIQDQDYRTAAQLLKQVQQESPNHPWLKFYIGRLYEATDKWDRAEQVYRKLLQSATNSKVITQARQGLQRLETLESNRRKAAISQATAQPQAEEPGVLILEPIAPEQKMAMAQQLARIFKTDAYTARMQLQSRGWRLYRTGSIGELQVYGEEMQQAGISVFWASLAEIRKINVFRVQYIQSLTPQPILVCRDHQDQLGSLEFSWSEVSQQVEGLLPLFMEAMDFDPRRQRGDRFRHKEMIQDYVQIHDLHLLNRCTILRFCDQSYQFHQGVSLTKASTEASEPSTPLTQSTTRLNWNQLLATFNQHLPENIWSEFTPFAETTLDYTQLLKQLPPQIDIERKSETPWDAAFQLYSGLVFQHCSGPK
ncbi:MAG: tetratricopeptide repeat protein [Oscillatoriales cyanobacterium RM2_1_1]|nr:tetratricopeptide repeat protein [Oscillatoriales cyanobacterium RM2_1_1]